MLVFSPLPSVLTPGCFPPHRWGSRTQPSGSILRPPRLNAKSAMAPGLSSPRLFLLFCLYALSVLPVWNGPRHPCVEGPFHAHANNVIFGVRPAGRRSVGHEKCALVLPRRWFCGMVYPQAIAYWLCRVRGRGNPPDGNALLTLARTVMLGAAVFRASREEPRPFYQGTVSCPVRWSTVWCSPAPGICPASVRETGPGSGENSPIDTSSEFATVPY